MPHRRFPHQLSRRRGSFGDTETKWIVRIQHQGDLGSHIRRAADDRDYFLALDTDHSLKRGPGDALLAPDLSGSEFSVGVQACELRTRARSAGRTVVLDAR